MYLLSRDPADTADGRRKEKGMLEGIKKACEDRAMFEPMEEAFEDRKLFVKYLGWLLSMTRDGVKGCELDDRNIVTVFYEGGCTRRINVYADSYAAIIRDVANRFQ